MSRAIGIALVFVSPAVAAKATSVAVPCELLLSGDSGSVLGALEAVTGKRELTAQQVEMLVDRALDRDGSRPASLRALVRDGEEAMLRALLVRRARSHAAVARLKELLAAQGRLQAPTRLERARRSIEWMEPLRGQGVPRALLRLPDDVREKIVRDGVEASWPWARELLVDSLRAEAYTRISAPLSKRLSTLVFGLLLYATYAEARARWDQSADASAETVGRLETWLKSIEEESAAAGPSVRARVFQEWKDAFRQRHGREPVPQDPEFQEAMDLLKLGETAPSR